MMARQRDDLPVLRQHGLGGLFYESVSDLVRAIRSTVEGSVLLQRVWVQGETNEVRVWPSGHCYFTLRDAEAAIDCVVWETTVRKVGGPPEPGRQVLAYGSARVYEKRGRLQFVVDFLADAAVGAAAAELERLTHQLESEGLFDERRKRPLPLYPDRVGVVTSAAGAVWHDIQNVCRQRWPLVELLLSAATVQGEGAQASIVEALDRLYRRHDIDVIIVGRGGGAADDLSAFNGEAVVRKIAASPVPIVSAVGHETDETLADRAADRRAPTPSAAAMLCVPDQQQVLTSVATFRRALGQSWRYAIDRARVRLRELLARLSTRGPDLYGLRSRCGELEQRLGVAWRRGLDDRRRDVRHAGERLAALSPLRTLERGYSVVSFRDSGRVVRAAVDVRPGDALTVRTADGSFGAEVAQ